MKRVLVYPCGTEIALEFYRALQYSVHYELVGGSSTYDHGRFIYQEHIDHLPFICDSSTREDVKKFDQIISLYKIDLIYPSMDGVIDVFSKYRDCLTPCLCVCEGETASVVRSKLKTYEVLKDIIATPKVYLENEAVDRYPVFIKPDVGQGSVNAKRIDDKIQLGKALAESKTRMVVSEYLSGEEFTVDCLSNADGKLVFSQGRVRKRIKTGISVNSVKIDDFKLNQIAEDINRTLKFKGAWFFQVKKNNRGEYVLMEVAARIAGASAYTRAMGINLPELTLEVFSGADIEFVIPNNYSVEQDRAFYNSYCSDLSFSYVYIDYDDTVICNKKLNDNVIRFIAKCKNHDIKVILLSKHEGDLNAELNMWGIMGLFDQVIQIDRKAQKFEYINKTNSIFIDDSFGERLQVYNKRGIPTFEPSMIEFLNNRRGF